MKKLCMSLSLMAALLLLLAEFTSQSPLRLGIVGRAEAVIGRPRTPFSYAGVARRSVYRHAAWTGAAMTAAAATAATANYAAANAAAAQAAAANTAAAQAAAANAEAAAAAAQSAQAALPIGSTVPYLPPNCASSVIKGTNYFNCGGVYYKPGFEGNHIVYIVSHP